MNTSEAGGSYVEDFRELYHGVTWVKNSLSRSKSPSHPISVNQELRKRIVQRLTEFAHGREPVRAFDQVSSHLPVLRVIRDDVLASQESLRIFKGTDGRTFCVGSNTSSSVYVPESWIADQTRTELLPLINVPQPVTLAPGAVIVALCELSKPQKPVSSASTVLKNSKKHLQRQNILANRNEASPAPPPPKRTKTLPQPPDVVPRGRSGRITSAGYPAMEKKLVNRPADFLVSFRRHCIVNQRELVQKPAVLTFFRPVKLPGKKTVSARKKASTRSTSILSFTPILTFRIPKPVVDQKLLPDIPGLSKARSDMKSRKPSKPDAARRIQILQKTRLSTQVRLTGGISLKRRVQNDAFGPNKDAAPGDSSIDNPLASANLKKSNRADVVSSGDTAPEPRPSVHTNRTFYFRGDIFVITRANSGSVSTEELTRRSKLPHVGMAYKRTCTTWNNLRRYGKRRIRLNHRKRVFVPKSKTVQSLLASDTTGQFPPTKVTTQRRELLCHLCDCLKTATTQCSRCEGYVCSKDCLELHKDVVCPARYA